MIIYRWHVAIYFIFASLRHCSSIKYQYIDLYFTSNQCNHDIKRVSASKVYRISWYGHIQPKLCSFTFTDQDEYQYEICFESLHFEIPNHLSGVKLKIRNNTRSSWVYNNLNPRIDRVCVKWGYHLNISIAVPPGYTEPASKLYIHLKVTAKVIKDDDGNVAEKIIGGFVSVIFLACIAGTCAKGSNSNRGFLGEICGSACSLIAYCLACKCLRNCDGPSCNCNDICRPCGDCCSAWAECCTTVLSRQPGSRNTSNDMQTEISNNSANLLGTSYIPVSMSEEQIPVYSNDANLQGTSFRTVSTSEEQPPMYESVRDQFSNIPAVPPPCYEDVILQRSLLQSDV